MLPESEGMRLRRMLTPAPVVVLNNRSSACFWVALLAVRIELAWLNASEIPKPSIVCNLVPPFTATVDAALAGTCVTARTAPMLTRLTAATVSSRIRRTVLGIRTSVNHAKASILENHIGSRRKQRHDLRS